MSVEVLGLAFIYFIAHSPSVMYASLNCLFNDAQRIKWWLADVVCKELQKPRMNVLFQCVRFCRCAETASLLSANQTSIS